MPHLEAQPATFASLDALAVETLALFLSEERGPLRGVLGLLDWRLCGELAQALAGGGITGKQGERLLMPTRGRVGPTRVLVFGVGAGVDKAGLTYLLKLSHQAGADELALELPRGMKAEDALAALQGYQGKRVVVLGAPDGVREKLGGKGR